MELSILQHAKDKTPQLVTLDEVVRQIRGDETWEPFTDRHFNNLGKGMQRIKPVIERHLHNEIESDFSPDFHPFRDYLDSLPPWATRKPLSTASPAIWSCVEKPRRFSRWAASWLLMQVSSRPPDNFLTCTYVKVSSM